jgi:hypothetical protein
MTTSEYLLGGVIIALAACFLIGAIMALGAFIRRLMSLCDRDRYGRCGIEIMAVSLAVFFILIKVIG